jgi:hypothetical protein
VRIPPIRTPGFFLQPLTDLFSTNKRFAMWTKMSIRREQFRRSIENLTFGKYHLANMAYSLRIVPVFALNQKIAGVKPFMFTTHIRGLIGLCALLVGPQSAEWI